MVGANQVGRKHAGLRSCMARFARLRSASRALPAAVSGKSGAAGREERASKLREGLAELAKREASSSEDLVQALDRATAEIGFQLDEMERDLLECMDALDLASLQGFVPRLVESHSHEILALLEVLLGQRGELLARLPKVEYLITMLSTVEVDGRRNFACDPVSLTPTLENFTVASLDPAQEEAFVLELHQAAKLDSDSENFHTALRSLRAHKQSVGLGSLCPSVLRAVVIYNARMFDCPEALSALSGASATPVDAASATSGAEADQLDILDFDGLGEDLEEFAPDALDAETDQGPVSVFDSIALQRVIEALRRRLDGERAGTDCAERVALLLDRSVLEPLEIAAIRAESPDADGKIVARTAVVGLMLRDVDPVEAEFLKLGIGYDQLSDAWVRELNEAFAKLISEKLSDARAYELTSRLSSIKSKHLLKPFNALKAGNREATSVPSGIDESSAEMDQLAQAAANSEASPKQRRSDPRGGGRREGPPGGRREGPPGGSREGAFGGRREGALGGGREGAPGGRRGGAPGGRRGDAPGRRREDAAARQGFSFSSLGESRLKIIAAAALLIIAFGFVVSNMIGTSPAGVQILAPRSLSQTSPYLQSAYRNEKGRGGFLVGRVDAQFEALPLEEKIEAAEEMVVNFEFQGIREAMLYDASGMMQVHYAGGTLYRPRPGSRATGRRVGEAAARRSLTGQVIDLDQPKDDDEDDWGGWDDS